MPGPLARSAAVFRKSFVFSSLPIRKVLVLPFRGGVSPSLGCFLFCFQRVIHRIVAPTTCSLTTCSLTTCICFHFQRRIERECFHFQRRIEPGMFPLSAGKLPKIRLPVDKTAIGPPGATFSSSGTTRRCSTSCGSARGNSGPVKGTCASRAGGLHSIPTRMILRLSGSFTLSIGLLASCRSRPVFRRDFVDPSHPRAIEKCGCDRKG